MHNILPDVVLDMAEEGLDKVVAEPTVEFAEQFVEPSLVEEFVEIHQSYDLIKLYAALELVVVVVVVVAQGLQISF